MFLESLLSLNGQGHGHGQGQGQGHGHGQGQGSELCKMFKLSILHCFSPFVNDTKVFDEELDARFIDLRRDSHFK